MKEIEVIGKRFGRLLVVSFSHKVKYTKYYNCLCDCGKSCIVDKGALLSKRQVSCGCYRREITASINRKPEGYLRLGKIYRSMYRRCYDQTSNRYERYGGRGIKICSEWLDNIDNFREWAINNGYEETLSIDRIDNDGDYCPDNCRWVSSAEQANNQCRNIYIDFNGQHLTLTQWAKKLNIPSSTLHNRIRVHGWDIERALTQPVRCQKR